MSAQHCILSGHKLFKQPCAAGNTLGLKVSLGFLSSRQDWKPELSALSDQAPLGATPAGSVQAKGSHAEGLGSCDGSLPAEPQRGIHRGLASKAPFKTPACQSLSPEPAPPGPEVVLHPQRLNSCQQPMCLHLWKHMGPGECEDPGLRLPCGLGPGSWGGEATARPSWTLGWTLGGLSSPFGALIGSILLSDSGDIYPFFARE